MKDLFDKETTAFPEKFRSFRTLWIGWFFGSMLALWLMSLTEVLCPLGISQRQVWLLCSVYAPLLTILAGLRRQSLPRLSEPCKQHPSWLAAATSVAVFALWGSGYYLIGLAAGKFPMRTLQTSLDQQIPLIPETSFVYLTVQWFVILSVTVAAEILSWKRILGAAASILFVCDLCFFFFPVHIVTTPVPVTSHSTWVLAMIRANDVASNCFPSSHCAMALFCALLLFHKSKTSGGLGLFCALSIGLSTLTTKQHYVWDVVVGFAIALLGYVVWFRKK